MPAMSKASLIPKIIALLRQTDGTKIAELTIVFFSSLKDRFSTDNTTTTTTTVPVNKKYKKWSVPVDRSVMFLRFVSPLTFGVVHIDSTHARPQQEQKTKPSERERERERGWGEGGGEVQSSARFMHWFAR